MIFIIYKIQFAINNRYIVLKLKKEGIVWSEIRLNILLIYWVLYEWSFIQFPLMSFFTKIKSQIFRFALNLLECFLFCLLVFLSLFSIKIFIFILFIQIDFEKLFYCWVFVYKDFDIFVFPFQILMKFYS